MAIRSKAICRHAGCNTLIAAAGYCAPHAHLHQLQSDAHRGSAHQRGYNKRWQKARLTFLRNNPVCTRCASAGLVVVATDVDHIIPHKGDQTLFWDSGNWQSLCKSCHSKKTAREDGGFGR